MATRAARSRRRSVPTSRVRSSWRISGAHLLDRRALRRARRQRRHDDGHDRQTGEHDHEQVRNDLDLKAGDEGPAQPHAPATMEVARASRSGTNR